MFGFGKDKKNPPKVKVIKKQAKKIKNTNREKRLGDYGKL